MGLELIDRYTEELKNDLDLDDLTLHDKQMKLPSVKHKWVARLIQQKYQKEQLGRKKRDLIEDITKRILQEAEVDVSQKGARDLASKSTEVQKIEQKIKEIEFAIEFIEKIERVCSQATFDIKNIIEIKKLELQ